MPRPRWKGGPQDGQIYSDGHQLGWPPLVYVEVLGPCALPWCSSGSRHVHPTCPLCGVVDFRNVVCISCFMNHPRSQTSQAGIMANLRERKN